MGMSTHIQFFRARNDSEMAKMLDAGYALQAAGILDGQWPMTLRLFLQPVLDEFGGMPEDRQSAIDRLLEIHVDEDGYKWKSQFSAGFEINLANVPEGTATIRVYNSW